MPNGTTVLCTLASCVCVMQSMLVKPASGNTYLILESDNTSADVSVAGRSVSSSTTEVGMKIRGNLGRLVPYLDGYAFSGRDHYPTKEEIISRYKDKKNENNFRRI